METLLKHDQNGDLHKVPNYHKYKKFIRNI